MLYTITNLRKERRQGQEGYALSVPEFSVRLREKILITGPSGCGKSTLLDMLGMVLRPDSVTAFTFAPHQGAGNDIAAAWHAGRLEELAACRRHVGYVLQTGALLPFLRVRDNILAPRRMLGLADESAAEALGEKLGIAHLLHKFPAQLSVGERQRAAIARALAAKPPVILADEPTAALDPAHAATVLDLFTHMVDDAGVTLILVTHAPEQVEGKGFRRLRVVQTPPQPGQITEAVLQP